MQINISKIIKLLLFLVTLVLICLSIIFYFKKDSKYIVSSIKEDLKSSIKDNVYQDNIYSDSGMPELVVQDFSAKEIGANEKNNWQILASKGLFFKASSNIECFDMVCKLFSNNNEIALLKAKKTFYNQIEKKIFFNNTINAKFYNFELHASRAILNLKKEEVIMSGGVESLILNDSCANNSIN